MKSGSSYIFLQWTVPESSLHNSDLTWYVQYTRASTNNEYDIPLGKGVIDRALIKNLVPENDYKFYVFSSSMDIIENLGGHSLLSNMVTASTVQAGSLATCEGELKLRATPEDGYVHLEWNDVSGD